jgi:hypothetical protein
MNTKQEKLIRLSLTKRLVMSVILSAIVGSTAAVACTAPFANEPPLSEQNYKWLSIKRDIRNFWQLLTRCITG